MSDQPEEPTAGSSLIPSLRYRDAFRALEWMERVLGLQRHAVYPGPENTVAHAELRHGRGMVMLGSASNPNPHPEHLAHPAEIGNRVTAPFYLVVPDCGPVWKRVKADGTEVLMELQTMSYGGQAFAVRDFEGYQWSVGEYDPWRAREAAASAETASEETASEGA